MDIACTTRVHRHQRQRTCEGCKVATCGPDDGWMTTTGRVYICADCLDKHRRQWMKTEGRA